MSRQTDSQADNPWHRSERTLSSVRYDKAPRSAQTLDSRVVGLLQSGLDEMALDLSEDKRKRILTYLTQLVRWNKSYNLTSVRDPIDMVSHHMLDALSVLPLLNRIRARWSASHLLDVGAGAGLPGIALTIASPDLRLTLIESNGKKAAFMRQVGIDLGLQQLEVNQQRVEKVGSSDFVNGPADIIICRAFRSLTEFLELTAHLVSDRTVILAMKGPGVYDELAELDRVMTGDDKSAGLASVLNNRSVDVESLVVPGLDAARTLVVLEPRAVPSLKQSTIQE